jgi:diguanylate cyclase
MGVRIAIDDFGTGYSSMSALCELPTDVIKIDRSFVNRLAEERTSRSVVEAIISMAHALGKITVAEGVETNEQVQILRRLGCDLAQGYFFARPVAPQEMPAVVTRLVSCRHDMEGADDDQDLTRFGT